MAFEEYVAMDEEETVWWELLDWDILAEVLTKKIENPSYVEEDQDEAKDTTPPSSYIIIGCVTCMS